MPRPACFWENKLVGFNSFATSYSTAGQPQQLNYKICICVFVWMNEFDISAELTCLVMELTNLHHFNLKVIPERKQVVLESSTQISKFL